MKTLVRKQSITDCISNLTAQLAELQHFLSSVSLEKLTGKKNFCFMFLPFCLPHSCLLDFLMMMLPELYLWDCTAKILGKQGNCPSPRTYPGYTPTPAHRFFPDFLQNPSLIFMFEVPIFKNTYGHV